MGELSNLGKQEKEESVFLVLLRRALDNKDTELLSSVLMGIQRAVENGGLHTGPASLMREYEIKELLKTGKGMIIVGTGTLGERIFIEDGKLMMPTGYEINKFNRIYHNNFRSIFNLSKDDEMTVSF